MHQYHAQLPPIFLCCFLNFLVIFANACTNAEEPVLDLPPFIRVYKDGCVDRFDGAQTVPPSFDPITNVESRDTLYSPEHNLSVRLFLRKDAQHNRQKLPLFVYYHGGGFVTNNAFHPTIHNFLNLLVSEANIIAVSVDYRLAPEHPLPAAFLDSWAALKWVASHVHGNGPEDWLNHHADFQQVFLSGDSAGANIAHQMALKHGHDKKLGGFDKFAGIIMSSPFFFGSDPIPGETEDKSMRASALTMWKLACPTSSGLDDPWINPAKDPNLGMLGCNRLQVFVSGDDVLRQRGWYYAEKLRESGWSGDHEVIEYKGEPHDFQLLNYTSIHSVDLRRRIVHFINQGKYGLILDLKLVE